MNPKPLIFILAVLLIICFSATSFAEGEIPEEVISFEEQNPTNEDQIQTGSSDNSAADNNTADNATLGNNTSNGNNNYYYGFNNQYSPIDESNLNDAFSISSDYMDPAGLMQTSYAQGYAPLIADNNAIIVLPLNIDISKIQPGSSIKTNVTLTGSPFYAKNFDTTIPYDQFQSGFYPFIYYLPLIWPRENGAYAVPISLTYTDTDGNNITQTFDINVIITDVPEPTPEPTETPIPSEAPTSQPKVILSNYLITPDPVYAGDMFTAVCTLKNTSDNMSVKNLTVIYRGQTTDLMPEEGANTSYIESISPGASEQFTFKMKTRADSTAGPQKISLDISYEDVKTTAYSVSDELTVQVRQHIRLTNDQPNFPSSAYIGDSIQTSLNLYNKGKNTLYNVTVDLDVEGLYPESSAFLGNMESGSSKTADIYATVGIDPAGENQTQSGHYNGNFIVSYEDEYGEENTLEVPVELDIFEMDTGDYYPEYEDPDMYEQEEDTGLPWWVWIVIAGGAAIVVIAVIVNVRKKKRERQLLEEMDDNDIS